MALWLNETSVCFINTSQLSDELSPKFLTWHTKSAKVWAQTTSQHIKLSICGQHFSRSPLRSPFFHPRPCSSCIRTSIFLFPEIPFFCHHVLKCCQFINVSWYGIFKFLIKCRQPKNDLFLPDVCRVLIFAFLWHLTLTALNSSYLCKGLFSKRP